MTVSIRPGLDSDRDWVLVLLEEGVRTHHFAAPMLLNARNALSAIVAGTPFQMMSSRGGSLHVSSVIGALRVAEIDGTPAAFLIVIRYAVAWELHLAATKKPYRRRGAFVTLIRDTMKLNAGGVPITARCYKKSTWAAAALTKLGFTKTKEGDPSEFTIQP